MVMPTTDRPACLLGTGKRSTGKAVRRPVREVNSLLMACRQRWRLSRFLGLQGIGNRMQGKYPFTLARTMGETKMQVVENFESNTTETWQDIPGFEGCYQASCYGRIRSVSRFVGHNFGGLKKLPGRVLKPFTLPGGYQAVSLCKDGAVVKMRVPRLVLAAFHGWLGGVIAACHNDNNPRNNHLSNLRWDTYAGNEHDKIAAGTAPRGENSAVAILKEDQVVLIKSMLETGTRGVDIAKMFNVSPSTVTAIKKGRSWRHLSCIG